MSFIHPGKSSLCALITYKRAEALPGTEIMWSAPLLIKHVGAPHFCSLCQPCTWALGEQPMCEPCAKGSGERLLQLHHSLSSPQLSFQLRHCAPIHLLGKTEGCVCASR